MHFECVVLPVLYVTHRSGRVVQGEDQAPALLAYGRWPIPRIPIGSGIFLQGQRRRGVGRAPGLLVLHGYLSGVLCLPLHRVESSDPIGLRSAEVVIQYMEQYGIECAATLRVGEDDDPKILLGHQHDARHESRYPASVSDQFAPAIIAQPPTERVGCKVRSQARKWAWLVACGED